MRRPLRNLLCLLLYAAGLPVQSEIDWRQTDFTYTYSFLRFDHFELGAGLGIHLIQTEATASSPNSPERSDYSATEIHQHSSVTFAGAKVRESLPPSLRNAAVVPDAPASASPAATAAPTSDVTVIVGTDVTKSAAPGAPDHS